MFTPVREYHQRKGERKAKSKQDKIHSTLQESKEKTKRKGKEREAQSPLFPIKEKEVIELGNWASTSLLKSFFHCKLTKTQLLIHS